MPEFLNPKIVDFGGLFVDGSAPGLPRGCIALLAGPAGSGKTTFAFAVVRDLMTQYPDARLLYVTTEMTREALKTEFDQFGWFAASDSVFGSQRFTHIQVPILALKGQSAIDAAIEALDGQRSERQTPGEVFIIIDTVTAILLDQRTPAKIRLALDMLIISIRNAFENDLLFAALLAEQSSAAHQVGIPPAEECAADAILKLDLKDSGEGRRLRTLSIAKCRGANMRVGDHTFAILTSTSLNSVIAQDLTKDRVRRVTGVVPGSSGKWGTVIVAPRPPLKPIGDANLLVSEDDVPPPALWSGTPGLDALLNEQPNLSADEELPGEPALYTGSTTLILGSAGSGKTIICLQFLLAETDRGRSMYVNFENAPNDVIRMFPNRDLREELRKFHYLYRRRANLDVNLWMLELIYAIKAAGIARVAIDGLSDLLATTGEQEYSRLVETLVKSIKQATDGNISIFLTYETMPQLDNLTPLAPKLAVHADNVIALRQIAIHDEWRKTIYVVKARGLNPIRQVREIRISSASGPDELPLAIQSGFESYANLLAGQPRPVDIVLQLFAENEPERRFNKKITAELQTMFAYQVNSFGFSRPEMIRAFDDAISTSSRVPLSDIRIISVDEWWIREYDVTLTGEPNPRHPLLSLDQFYGAHASVQSERSRFTAASDHWLFEIEKASVVRTSAEKPSHVTSSQMAVPLYMDYGLFCFNRSIYSKLPGRSGSDPATYLRGLPRVWSTGSDGVFAAPGQQDPSQTLVALMFQAKQIQGADFVGYAFDLETMESAVCTYLEFCWAFGARELPH